MPKLKVAHKLFKYLRDKFQKQFLTLNLSKATALKGLQGNNCLPHKSNGSTQGFCQWLLLLDFQSSAFSKPVIEDTMNRNHFLFLDILDKPVVGFYLTCTSTFHLTDISLFRCANET